MTDVIGQSLRLTYAIRTVEEPWLDLGGHLLLFDASLLPAV
jgi:hypothetical protein